MYLLPSCAVDHNSVHIASNTKLLILNCQSASVLQALVMNCEAVVHGLQVRRVYEVSFLPVPWPRMIDFDRSFFVGRINHPACHNGPHPTGPQPREQLAVLFSKAMLWGPQMHIFQRVETNTTESSTSANHSAFCSASTTDFATHAKMIMMIRLAPNAGSVLRWPTSAQTRYCDLLSVLKGRITSALDDAESPSSKCVHARSCIDMDRGSQLG